MSRLHEQLVADHENLAAVLDVLEREIALYDQPEERERNPDLPLLHEIMDYIHDYPEAFHHPLEEAAFDYLQEQGLGDATAIQRIRTEHEELDRQSSQTRELLQAIESDQPVLLRKLQEQIGEFLKMQRQHMQHEEDTVFTAIRELDEQACETIRSRVHPRMDPLRANDAAQQFERLLSYLEG